MPDIYSNGTYLANNPTWHEEDAAWKAARIAELLERNGVRPATVCEVGCGSGAVLQEVSKALGGSVRCIGYDVSPYAYAIARTRAGVNLQFEQADFLAADAPPFDVVMAIDVIEHVEDCIGFVRRLRSRGRYKVFHIPLDLSVQSVLRATPLAEVRRNVGHLHYFTRETALATLRDGGHEIVDAFYTKGALDLPSKSVRGSLAKLPRRLAYAVNRDAAVRVLGGFSLMVLTT